MVNTFDIDGSSQRYDTIALLLHWSMALILVYLIFLSHFEDLSDDVMTSKIQIHSELGLLIVLLGVIRWYWRQTHPRPSNISHGTLWQVIISKFVHLAFYASFLITPAIGFILAGLVSYPVNIFGMLDISSWIQDNEFKAALTNSIHGFSADVLLVLLMFHVGAVLYHQFVRHDGLVWLMLPIGR